MIFQIFCPIRESGVAAENLKYTNSIKKKWAFVIQKGFFMKRTFITLCSLFAFAQLIFADGDCHLVQQSDGSWQILCSGTGIQIQYETVSNEVYIIENCEELKSELQDSFDGVIEGFSSIYQDYQALDEWGTRTGADDDYIFYTHMQSIGDMFSPSGLPVYETKSLINDITCGSCPTNGSSGGGSDGSCCPQVDFSQIVDLINQEIYAINAVSNILFDIQFSIDSGFGSTTNALNVGFGSTTNAIYSGFGSTTNALYLTHQNFTNYLDRIVSLKNAISSFGAPTYIDNMHLMQKRFSNTQGGPVSVSLSSDTYLKNYRNLFYIPKNYGYLGSIYASSALSTYLLQSINEFQHNQYLYQYPSITNFLGSIQTSVTNGVEVITNFFSFFRDTTEGYGVLADYSSSYGTYHDFLTNYYILASSGNLSPSVTNKTNWFYRVEALLAALVFNDSSGTNTVNVSQANGDASRLSSSFGDINSDASIFSQGFSSNSQRITTLYQDYFNLFSEATMPSRVKLVVISSNHDEAIYMDLQGDQDSQWFFDGARAVTTFCWVSVGIFALYKFLSWSARCIIVACVFIYRVVGGVFHKA